MHRLDNVIISNWFCQFAPGVKREKKQYLDTKWAIYKSAIEESVRDNESCSQNPSGVTSEKRMTSIGKINHFYFCFWCFIAFLPPPPSHSPPNTCSAWSSYLLIDSLNWERLQFFCVRNKPILSLNHASRKPSFFVRVRVTISPPPTATTTTHAHRGNNNAYLIKLLTETCISLSKKAAATLHEHCNCFFSDEHVVTCK